MTSLWVIRHGEASASFGRDLDPGLSGRGHRQAAALAARLSNEPRRPVFSSPMQRARETAEPLATAWEVAVAVTPVIRAIPSPANDLQDRSAWLHQILPGTWDDVDAAVNQWRDTIVEAAAGVRNDQVWFSHSMAINALVSHLLGDSRVAVVLPVYAAVLELEVSDDGALSIVAMPDEGESVIG